MNMLAGRIIRGVLRRFIAEVVKAVKASEVEEEAALNSEAAVALMSRLHAHPDVTDYDIFPNEWGGYTVRFTMREQDLAANGNDVEEALAKAVTYVWGLDT